MASPSSIQKGKVQIICAADPYGASLHDVLVAYLRKFHADVEVEDLGVFSKYYVAAHAVGVLLERAVTSQTAESPSREVRGLLICGSGVGMSIVANKFPHVYAACAYDVAQAKGCRSVNNTNCLTLGARVTDQEDAKEILDAWLRTQMGQGWAADIQAFIERSMPEISALDFSATARISAADAAPPENA